jgi:group I intron endonuclease
MRLFKTQPILALVNSYIIDSPSPSNISYLWNYGSLLGLCLILQIITGVTLAMHFAPNADLAFISVEHIMRDVNFGWFLRYAHANVASFFFIFVYIHMGRGLYYGSYKSPRILLWTTGVIIYLIMMATAFLGYLNSLTWFELNLISRNSNIESAENLYLFLLLSNINNNGLLAINKLKPIKTYENLTIISTQLLIRNENKHKSAIYAIVNLINGKYYIGSAISNRINVRFRNHCIHGTGSSYLNKSIKKYGLENFAFLILEYYPHIVQKENLKARHLDLLNLETQYINNLKPEYNILQYGVYSIGYKHSQETINKMKTNYSEARKLKIKNLNLNKKLSDDTKILLKQSAIIRYADNIIKDKISKSLSKSVILYNLDGTIHSKYSGIRVMARTFKCCHKTINNSIKLNKVFKNIGYIKYETEIL